ncbi:PilN domain-containing protein [Myxococcota bacterium]
MLRINLLPIKAARKHDTAKQEILVFLGGVVVIFIGLFAYHSSLKSDLTDLRQRTQNVKEEIERLKRDVVRVEEFKKKAATLEDKIQVIRGLQTKRIGPAKMLDEIATILTNQEKVWLTRLVEAKGSLTIEGAAMEHENISEFKLALERHSKLVKNVRLTMVKSVARKGAAYLEWQMVCKANYGAG